MSGNQQTSHDSLVLAIQGFQGMTVPERPPDAELLAQLGSLQGELSRTSCVGLPAKWRYAIPALLSSAAAGVLLLGGLALFLLRSAPPETVQVASTSSPEKTGDVPVQAPPRSAERESLRERSFEQQVADAQVIVVATAVGSAPAPPRRPGDLPEVLLQFQVKRVLKGKLAAKVITTRTPTAAAEFIGKDWVILLAPDYMAGKHGYASHVNVKFEPTVKAILSKEKK